MTVTPIPTLNATALSDNFTYVNTTTDNYGGPILLLTTWIIIMLHLEPFPLTDRVRTATFLTLIESLFFQAISLSFSQITGILLAVLILNEIYAGMTKPEYG